MKLMGPLLAFLFLVLHYMGRVPTDEAMLVMLFITACAACHVAGTLEEVLKDE